MKFIIPGFVLALATSVAASDQATCLHNHPNIWVAITELCSRGDLVVPSNYLSKGMWHGGRYALIGGVCTPSQFVPHKYCISQFMNMCAIVGKKEKLRRYYGNFGCQWWEVNSAWNIPPLGATG